MNGWMDGCMMKKCEMMEERMDELIEDRMNG